MMSFCWVIVSVVTDFVRVTNLSVGEKTASEMRTEQQS